MNFVEAMAELPLVAILRGVKPDEAVPIGAALVAEGFRLIEVPLNSPDPFVSIQSLQAAFGDRAVIGAGTVIRADDVDRLAATGARLCVSPHTDVCVIRQARQAGLIALPGAATPSEGFAALAAGADALKLFPAEAMPPAVVKAWRAVFPREVALLPVGGVTPESMAGWRAAGAGGFGLGSALYKPGMGVADVAARARAFVGAWRAG
ncbi:MAG: 2-dehydro-3-deoxy-6-phosphogalactonate aldolase [Rhizobiales bacterium]|nr:2-dehydro-3-deoxy-6-phosphogalactonate aldolase [Hyphomicrobiales bacterium]